MSDNGSSGSNQSSDSKSSSDSDPRDSSDGEHPFVQPLMRQLAQVRDYVKQLTNAITVGPPRTFPILLDDRDDRVVLSADTQIIIYELYQKKHQYDNSANSESKEVRDDWQTLRYKLEEELERVIQQPNLDFDEYDREDLAGDTTVLITDLTWKIIGVIVTSMH